MHRNAHVLYSAKGVRSNADVMFYLYKMSMNLVWNQNDRQTEMHLSNGWYKMKCNFIYMYVYCLGILNGPQDNSDIILWDQ